LALALHCATLRPCRSKTGIAALPKAEGASMEAWREGLQAEKHGQRLEKPDYFQHWMQ
jgi:hypothetical protein